MTDITPQQVRTASFRTVRKGFDPDEVGSFLRSTAEALEVAQNQSAAMEARARAAVARLQELNAGKEAPAPSPPEEIHAPVEEAQIISRTLLLAQRTADQTVADANAEAERILAAARAEAETTIDSTRELSARLMDEARAEARAATDEERRRAQEEVQALLARRDFLLADVDHLEGFLVDQRERIRDAAGSLLEICDRVPGGLAGVRKPLLSASDEGVDGDLDATVAITTGERADPEPGDDPDDDLDDTGETEAPTAGDSTADDAAGVDESTADTSDSDAADEPDELVIRTSDDPPGPAERPSSDAAPGSTAADRTPPAGEPQLRFDANDLRRLGESREIG